MKLKLSDLWRWDGTVDRGPYVFYGLSLFAIKYNLDRLVAAHFFKQSWSLFNYLASDVIRPSGSDRAAAFYATLVGLALPFIWSGVALTLRRLRSVDLPEWLVVAFFLPFVNLLFFAILGMLPARPEAADAPSPRAGRFKRFLDRLIPANAVGSALVGMLLTGGLAVASVLFGVSVLGNYGWGVFVGVPFCLGLFSVLVYGYHAPRGFGSCLSVAALSVVFAGLVLIVLAIEGLVCLIMAAPISLAIALIGGTIGYVIQRRRENRRDVHLVLLVAVPLLPVLMGAESLTRGEPPLLEVTTGVEIDAPPERVWRHVVSFSALPEPDEWLFRIGLAYPIRAEIRGRGVGAERHCLFSTGPFVEPIEVWDEPRLLKFSVTENPAPMEEWTPYAAIHPPHLKGFLVSKGGQFRLIPLPGGRTRLEGTTWYHHHMWPAAYWQVGSDFVIHRIHARVLKHLKRLAERDQQE